MAMDFTQIWAFHAVALQRGFTAAARVLAIGQPTLSTQVKALETAYGVELFLRKGKEIALTEAGAALFDITKGLMSFHAQAHDLLRAGGRFEAGTLRLATVGPFHATDILAAFRRAFPRRRSRPCSATRSGRCVTSSISTRTWPSWRTRPMTSASRWCPIAGTASSSS